MTQIHILIQCDTCHKEATIHITSDIPSPPCQCSDKSTCQPAIDLPALTHLMQQAGCPHEHISTTGGYHFSGGDVWDDITEVCDDCGAILSYQPKNEDFDDNT